MNERILIVEENDDVRTGLQRQIVASGYTALQARDAAQAMELVRKAVPDLLLYGLPPQGRAGDNLLDCLREEGFLGDLPVIVMSSLDKTNLICHSLDLGAEDYLIKPIKDPILNSRISNCLARKRHQDQLKHRLTRLEKIFVQMPNTILIALDPEGLVLHSNTKAGQQLGFAPENRLENLPLAEVLTALPDSVQHAILDIFQKGAPVHQTYFEGPADDTRHTLYVVSLTLVDTDPEARTLPTLRWILLIRDLCLMKPKRDGKPKAGSFHGIVGEDPAIVDLCRMIRRVAPLPSSVLITGPTGSGKELVARAIHEESDRTGKPFIAVNCTALSKEILESELFGHVRGAFTSAIASRKGRFREASGGTLFLDEIGDTTESFQTKLLRVLETRLIYPVGEDRPVPVDVRILCATNRDLPALVKDGRFREDLYYRINVVSIHIPPLLERPTDVPLLVEHFCRVFNQRFHKSIHSVSHEAMRVLMAHDWPGNVRELSHVMERAFVIAEGPAIVAADLPPGLVKKNVPAMSLIPVAEPGHAPQTLPPGASIASDNLMDEAERIRYAMARAEGNATQAAKILKIHRTTLWRKIKELNLDLTLPKKHPRSGLS